jgi:hypothetical protein
MLRRMVVLLLLGVTAASSDEACRTDCFELSDECKATCFELSSEQVEACFAECGPSLASCIRTCGNNLDNGQPVVALVKVHDGPGELSRRLTTYVPVGFGDFTLVLRHDDKPEQTSWTFSLQAPIKKVASQAAGSYKVKQGTVTKSFKITTSSEYKFVLKDADGIKAPGYLKFLLNGKEVYNESPFHFKGTRSVAFSFF